MTSPATPQSLREYVRGHASEFLVDPNITSVGVGHKVVDGRRIDEVCVQFTVRQKVDLAEAVRQKRSAGRSGRPASGRGTA